MSNITERTYAELDALRGRLPELRRALVPGTRRRWSQRDLSAGQRARLDALARVERDTRAVNLVQGVTGLGGGLAPLRTDVLDAETTIGYGVAELEAAVCERFGLTSARASTSSAITRLIGLLERVEEDDTLAAHTLAEARRMNRLAGSVLGDAEQVRRLDARCPHCDSRSLRALPDRDLIVCANGVCRCDDERCGCHLERSQQHRWTYAEWEDLAQVLNGETGAVA